jgi:iron(III) transport system substrate-binding protein
LASSQSSVARTGRLDWALKPCEAARDATEPTVTRAALAALGILGAMLVSSAGAVALAEPAGRKTEIRVLTDRTEAHLAPIFAAFEAATHISVSAVYLDRGLLTRLEQRPTEADVVLTKDADLLEFARQRQLLQPYAAARVDQVVPAQLRDAAGMYFSDCYRARVIFYSKDRVRPEELSTYEALAGPKWKGRVCIRSGYHDYNLSLFSQLAATVGLERTRAFIRGLADNLARTPSGSDRDQVRGIYERKCDVALVNSYYMGIMLATPEQRAWGVATRVFFPDQAAGGTYVLRSGLAVTKATRSVAAARALLEFLVEASTQDLIASLTFQYPADGSRPWPQVTRELGAGQPGIKGGRFAIHPVGLSDMVRQRDAVIRMLDEVRFDRRR